MSMLHENSFIKAFDDFFVQKLAPEHERQTGIKINYEPMSVGSLLTRLTTVVETKSGREISATGLNQCWLFDQSFVDLTDVASPAMSESVAKYVVVDMFGKACQGASTKDVIATAVGQLKTIYKAR